ncbi:MAG: peptidoglycan editing factor PgeF [Smithellaceae bacterium]|nr:peptidoglycan editing factor PgeF [Smithellaceae bacterium]
MFVRSKKGPIECCEAKNLLTVDSLVHGFCTRLGGTSEGVFSSFNVSSRTGDDPGRVRKNLGIFAWAVGIEPEQLLLVNQVHGSDVLIVDRPGFKFFTCQGSDFDAIITDQADIAIGIKTADCVPIFLADRQKKIIAVIHAGWKGTALGIVAKVVDVMVGRFSCAATDILAAIGPAIGPCCYQVDESVYREMAAQPGRGDVFQSCAEPGHWMLDLPLANFLQLKAKGVPSGNINVAELCTSCHTNMFFSHRGEAGKTGRQLNFMMIRK